MARTWKPIPFEEAEKHPLYGVRGWLLFFAFTFVFGLLWSLLQISSVAVQAGRTLSELMAVDHPAVSLLKLGLILHVVMAGILYAMMANKYGQFRQAASAFLLSAWPLLAFVGFIKQGLPFIDVFVPGTTSWAVYCAIWVTYLQRSRRVRVTFEHLVLNEDPQTSRSEGGASQVLRKSPTVRAPAIPADVLSPPSSSPSPAPPFGSNAAAEAQASLGRNPPLHSNAQVAERFWEKALAEADGPERRLGLWGRAFAEALGDEHKAKAHYIALRAHELAEIDRQEREQLHAELARQEAIRNEALVNEAKKAKYLQRLNNLSSGSFNAILEFVESVPSAHWSVVFNLPDEHGSTLLHTAAREGFSELVQLLLSRGADPSLRGPRGMTALQIAERNRHWDVVEVLRPLASSQTMS